MGQGEMNGHLKVECPGYLEMQNASLLLQFEKTVESGLSNGAGVRGKVHQHHAPVP